MLFQQIKAMCARRVDGRDLTFLSSLQDHGARRQVNEYLSLVVKLEDYPVGFAREFGYPERFQEYIRTWGTGADEDAPPFTLKFPQLLLESDLERIPDFDSDPDVLVEQKDWTSDTRVWQVRDQWEVIVRQWQSSVFQRRKAWVRTRIMGWHPTRKWLDYNPMEGLPFSTVGAWYRVNRKLRENSALKASVEADEAVLDAAAGMDEALLRYMDGYDVQSDLPVPSSTPGNRFPVPLNWWRGTLPVWSDSLGSPSEDAAGIVSTVSYQAAKDFRAGAGAFRVAVAARMAGYELAHR